MSWEVDLHLTASVYCSTGMDVEGLKAPAEERQVSPVRGNVARLTLHDPQLWQIYKVNENPKLLIQQLLQGQRKFNLALSATHNTSPSSSYFLWDGGSGAS